MKISKDFQDMCGKVSEEIMRPYFRQQEYLYIDVDLLADFRLGAVLASVRNEQEYNYVQANMQKYLDAPTLRCAEFFPELGLTDQQLDEIIEKPEYESVLSVIAPRSKLITQFPTLFGMLKSINSRAETSRPLKLYFNCPHRVSDHFKAGLLELVKEADPTVEVYFTEFKTWYDVDPDILGRMDFIAVYDLIGFLANNTSSMKLLSAIPSKLGSTGIAALVQTDKPDMKGDELELGLVNLANLLEMMCDKFTYLRKTVLTKEDVNV